MTGASSERLHGLDCPQVLRRTAAGRNVAEPHAPHRNRAPAVMPGYHLVNGEQLEHLEFSGSTHCLVPRC